MSDQVPTIPLGDLRELLAGYDDSFEVSFSGLDFCRVKQRGEKLIQIEFEQLVFRDGDRVRIENL